MTERAPSFAILRRRTILHRSIVGLSLFVLGALSIIVPQHELAEGVREARACFVSFAEPRGPELPSCASALQHLKIPAHFPWTANRARFAIEELGVRTAHFEYVNATVGKPNREAISRAVEAIDHWSTVVQNGSTRVGFSELGPSIGAPDLGREADELGDRQTLIQHGDQFFNWRVRLSTLRAALLSGDLEKTKALGKRYAVDDPHDPDLRSAVAAVLCLGPDLDKGSHMLAFIQDDRAGRRYENLSRDYGEVRAMLVACLAKLDRPPPPLPTNNTAGSPDALEQRALLRLRLADTPASDASRTMALATITRLLDGAPREPGARLALLAALLATESDQDPARIVRYAKPKYEELPLAPALTLTANEWVMDHRPATGDSEPPALLPGSTFIVAAHTIETLVVKLDEPQDKREVNQVEGTKETNEVLRRELVAIRGALLLEAAASLTRDGSMEEALHAADDAARVLDLNKQSLGLLRSNIHWLSGDREKALADLDVDGNIAHGATDTENRLLAAVSVQEAELAQSLRQTDRAKQAAHRAETFATAAKDSVFFARAKWMLAALGATKATAPSRDELLTPMPFPAVGFAHPLEIWRTLDQDKQRALIDKALGPWVGLSAADPTYRRAGRWAAMRARGDAPPWLSVHLFLASHLLDPSEGDSEVWLDALMAMDQRRFSLRSYAFARAEAARMRGDTASAATWDERFQTLRKLAAEVPHYELTRHLDI